MLGKGHTHPYSTIQGPALCQLPPTPREKAALAERLRADSSSLASSPFPLLLDKRIASEQGPLA